MKLERVMLTIALFAILLSLPIANRLKGKDNQIQIQKSQTQVLQVEFKTVEQKLQDKQLELKQKDLELNDKEKQKDQTQQENVELRKQLEAKAKRKEAEKLAAAKADSTRRTITTGSGNCAKYRPLVAQYSWNVDIAMAVMRAESGCRPLAANYKDNHGVCMGSFGLFQISCHGGKIFDPEKNVAAAWGKYQARGWQPWGAFTNLSYKRYL